jgi:hypothetical protein
MVDQTIPPHIEIALEKLKALDGQECPSGPELCKYLGYQSNGAIANLLSRMARSDMITLIHINGRRVIAAADGSWKTLPPPKKQRKLHVKQGKNTISGAHNRPKSEHATTAMSGGGKRVKLPRITTKEEENEARKLIEDFLKKRGATICPPAGYMLSTKHQTIKPQDIPSKLQAAE